jgi:periplasmic copper chaperone A
MKCSQAALRASQLAGLAFALTLSGTAGAHEFKAKGLVIDHPHTMATAPGQPHGGVFFNSITNTSAKADQLIGARASVSKSIEVHRMEVANNVMKMREIPAIDLPANSKVTMGRGSKEGYHLMLMNLKAPLKDGDKFPMTLLFKNAGEVEITVAVEKPSMPMHGGHKH